MITTSVSGRQPAGRVVRQRDDPAAADLHPDQRLGEARQQVLVGRWAAAAAPAVDPAARAARCRRRREPRRGGTAPCRPSPAWRRCRGARRRSSASVDHLASTSGTSVLGRARSPGTMSRTSMTNVRASPAWMTSPCGGVAVGQVGRDVELEALARRDADEALVPAGDDAAGAERARGTGRGRSWCRTARRSRCARRRSRRRRSVAVGGRRAARRASARSRRARSGCSRGSTRRARRRRRRRHERDVGDAVVVAGATSSAVRVGRVAGASSSSLPHAATVRGRTTAASAAARRTRAERVRASERCGSVGATEHPGDATGAARTEVRGKV